ncbi:MAG: flagellin [Thermodesulfobacteriota bacterium]
MALRINTNIAALTAHKNMIKNDNGLSASLEKLSSGLRINKAADDASGMAIADSLRSQSLGLGQAVRNANDGISMVQTADGALDEAINIVNTIKTKAIQAAQDGQTTESRNAIQADVNKLLQELDIIARTTAFNNQKLLSGQFTNKKFQVGAYTGETVGISIASAESTKVGHVTTGQLTPSGVGEVRLSIYSNLLNQEVSLQSVQLAYDNTAENSMGALANAINKVADITGVSAQANVESTSVAAVAAGSTGTSFAINGITIGAMSVQANDADGSLANAINAKTSQHGVLASVDESGFLTLTSTDGRAIQVSGDTGVVLAGSNLSTLGTVKLFQTGANEIKISDAADNVTLNLTASVVADGDVTTSVDSTLTKNSILISSSVIQKGSTLGFTLDIAGVFQSMTAITTIQDSLLTAGSTVGSASTIESGTILTGSFVNSADVTSTSADSLLKTNSVITAGTTIAAGTTVTTRLATTTGWIEAGTVLGSDVTTSGSNTLLADMLVKANSTIQSGSTFTAGSYIGGDFNTSGTSVLATDMTLKSGSILGSDSIFLVGSQIGAALTLSGADATMTADMTLKAGSTIQSESTLAKGSTVGGATTISTSATLSADMTLAAGSQLANASTIKAGTTLTNDIWAAGGTLLKAGTTLTGDVVVSGTNYLSESMTLKSGSVVASASVLGAAATSSTGATATTTLSDVVKSKLSDVNVTTQEGAQVAIAVADSALKTLDKVRSDLGSVQNQLTSTIANLSATKVNIAAAESSIRDVDFADEAAMFSKMQILTQASSFAMAQANASGQTVLALLQG